MEFKTLDPIAGVHRVSLNGETYIRMADLSREFDAKYGLKGIGSEICKLFRQSKQNTFFYVEMNPTRKRGYYIHEDMLDQLVHFAAANHDLVRETFVGTLDKPKARSKQKTHRKQTSPARAADERFNYPIAQIEGKELGYFMDGPETWVRIADIARLLRPETQLFATIPTTARVTGLPIRAITHPLRGPRPSYFVPMSRWNELCALCKIGPAAIMARTLRNEIASLHEPVGIELSPPVISGRSELDELKAMNAKLLDTVNSMMAVIAKQADGPVKVGA